MATLSTNEHEELALRALLLRVLPVPELAFEIWRYAKSYRFSPLAGVSVGEPRDINRQLYLRLLAFECANAVENRVRKETRASYFADDSLWLLQDLQCGILFCSGSPRFFPVSRSSVHTEIATAKRSARVITAAHPAVQVHCCSPVRGCDWRIWSFVEGDEEFVCYLAASLAESVGGSERCSRCVEKRARDNACALS